MSDIDFIEKENRELNNLQKTFTPQQQDQYKEEVEYIKYLLDILGENDKKPNTPENKKEKKKEKKEVNKALKQFVNSFTLSKATNITHAELSPEEMLDAKLSKMSDKYYKNGGMDSENYMEQADIKGWKINEELSNDKGLVVYNEETGKAKVAFRGTDKTNIGDIEADARIYVGSEQNHEHFTTAKTQMREAIEKYGLENVSTTGYSLGGNKSWNMGNDFGVPSTGFNPFIGKNIVNQPENFRTGIKHKIIRTQDDMPSLQSSYLEGKNNTEVVVVSTLGGEMNALNPYKAHSIDNFISNEGRNDGGNSGLGGKMEQLSQHAQKHGELRTLHDMLKQNKTYNVRNLGEMNETDYMNRLNNIDATLTERSRINDLTRADRLEVKTRARTQFLKPDIQTRDKDFESGLFPPPKKTPISNYQTDLEMKALNLPKPHLPKKTLPKNIAEEIRNSDDAERFLQDYNQDGTPISEKPVNIRKQTQALETGREYLNNRSSKGNYAFQPEVDTIGNETRLLEQKLVNNNNGDTYNIREQTKLKLARTNNISAKTKTKLLGLRNRTNPPLEKPTPTSRLLNTKTQQLENEIIDIQPTTQQPINQETFTTYANNNNIDANSNHKKSLWEKSGGKLTTTEKENYNTEDSSIGNTDTDIDSFIQDTPNEREQILEEHSKTQQNMETELNNIDNSGIRTGKSFGMETARGLHPANLILGYIVGKGADDIMNTYVNKYLPNQPEPLKIAETGAIAGGITSTILGTALAPEIASGAVGYVAQKYTTDAVRSGLNKLGASKDVSDGVGLTVGGGVGGFLAGAVGSATAGSIVGAEDGAIAGGGIFSAETATIGGIIGSIVGLGSFVKARYYD
jgi:hypothetical protein